MEKQSSTSAMLDRRPAADALCKLQVLANSSRNTSALLAHKSLADNCIQRSVLASKVSQLTKTRKKNKLRTFSHFISDYDAGEDEVMNAADWNLTAADIEVERADAAEDMEAGRTRPASKTAFSFFSTKTNNRGPHVISNTVLNAVASGSGERTWSELLDTYMVPAPGTVEKLMSMILNTTQSANLDSYLEKYGQLWDAAQEKQKNNAKVGCDTELLRNLLEMHPLASYSINRLPNSDEIGGKGERTESGLESLKDIKISTNGSDAATNVSKTINHLKKNKINAVDNGAFADSVCTGILARRALFAKSVANVHAANELGGSIVIGAKKTKRAIEKPIASSPLTSTSNIPYYFEDK